MDPATRRRYVPAAAVAVVVLVTSLVPVPQTGGDQLPTLLGVALDKWAHALGYGVLAVLLAWGRRTRAVAAVLVLGGLVAGYGAAIEGLQALVPTREASVADGVANALGALVGGLVWLVARRGRDRFEP